MTDRIVQLSHDSATGRWSLQDIVADGERLIVPLMQFTGAPRIALSVRPNTGATANAYHSRTPAAPYFWTAWSNGAVTEAAEDDVIGSISALSITSSGATTGIEVLI